MFSCSLYSIIYFMMFPRRHPRESDAPPSLCNSKNRSCDITRHLFFFVCTLGVLLHYYRVHISFVSEVCVARSFLFCVVFCRSLTSVSIGSRIRQQYTTLTSISNGTIIKQQYTTLTSISNGTRIIQRYTTLTSV